MSDGWTREYIVEVRHAELIAGSPFSNPFREEIVRCRDCRWAKLDQSDHEYRGEYRCNMWIADMGADEFCSRGRRKEADA